MNKEVNKIKYNIFEKKKSIKRFTFSNIQIKKKISKNNNYYYYTID